LESIYVCNVDVCNVDVCNVDVCNVVFAMLIGSGAKLAHFYSGVSARIALPKPMMPCRGGDFSGHKPVKLMVKKNFPFKFLLKHAL
jgi:hypothetical protein